MRNVEEQIDKVLQSLNAAEAPARLEQRVMARVAQRSAEVAATSDSRFENAQALMKKLAPYAIGAAMAVVLCAAYVAWPSHTVPGTGQQTSVRPDAVTPAPKVANVPTQSHAVRSMTLRGPASVATGSMATPASPADDPDAIALAETMAPSRPAPPMPATSQEAMAMPNKPSGRVVEMAELRTPHDPGFRTERERTAIRQYILGLLDPLVTAQNLTSSPPLAENPPAPPAPADTTSTN